MKHAALNDLVREGLRIRYPRLVPAPWALQAEVVAPLGHPDTILALPYKVKAATENRSWGFLTRNFPKRLGKLQGSGRFSQQNALFG